MMSSQPIADRLKTHLSRVGADIVHAASTRVQPDGLNILIDRAPLSFPIGEDDIAALISIAEPAHFGSGEDTVFDPTVRDTWVIDPAHVHLGDPTGAAGTDNWTGALNESLGCLSAALGIPADATVRAELHSMLVYGEGQFFLPHQDSEKDDSMLATLVVGLPTTHTGGELVVDDHGADRIFTGDPNDITLAAFYADRRHEVKPVTSGHRVTLTFNLLVDHPAAEDTTDDDHTMTTTAADDAGTGDPVDSELRALITEYFTTPVKPRWGGGNATPPQRMVFLLDHEYSRHGLSRTTLKGGDRLRAACLLSAARSAGCEAMLGLSEIHETREAAIDDRGGYYGNRCGRYWDDENEPDIETFDTDGELLDGVITLNWWMVPDKGIGESIESRVGEEETLAVTSTRQLTAHAAEYEGYMGNYGNTVDHWYRRAAIILWPMESSFVVRAEAGSGWALRTLADRLTQGQIAEAAADARSLEPFWSGAGPESLDLALEVALGVEDRTAATVVLTPYGIAGLGAEQAEALGALTERYGT
ncbi:MAG: 2OG-Fe(II) oxygenase, partial [Brevibacterium aurantiacum]